MTSMRIENRFAKAARDFLLELRHEMVDEGVEVHSAKISRISLELLRALPVCMHNATSHYDHSVQDVVLFLDASGKVVGEPVPARNNFTTEKGQRVGEALSRCSEKERVRYIVWIRNSYESLDEMEDDASGSSEWEERVCHVVFYKAPRTTLYALLKEF